MRSLKRFMVGGRGEIEATAELVAVPSGTAGKDGFTGYSIDLARGSLTPDDAYRGMTCTGIYGQVLSTTITVEFAEALSETFLTAITLPTVGELLTADADTFDNNGGAGPSYWLWNNGVGRVYSGTVTFRG